MYLQIQLHLNKPKYWINFSGQQKHHTWQVLQYISVIIIFYISCEIILIWMPMDIIYDKPMLLQMGWCREATSHYLMQYSLEV